MKQACGRLAAISTDETTASGPVEVGTPGLAGFGELAQGSLEASNVNVVAEMVSMIETQHIRG